MNNTKFKIIAEEKFSFLTSDFKFKLIKSHGYNWGYELLYLNEVTGVKIIYEYREAYIFITLCELLDGKIIENPFKIEEDSILYCHSLDDVINIRHPSDLVKPAYQYSKESKYYDEQNGLALYVATIANNLKKYASDILLGNFSIFKKLDRVVKDRVENFNRE